MGIGPRISINRIAGPDPLPRASNPDPLRYELVRHETVNDCLIVEIKYDGVTNYEGRKVMVFPRFIRLHDLQIQKGGIDPHFSDDPKVISPIARFRPNEHGWELARKICARP